MDSAIRQPVPDDVRTPREYARQAFVTGAAVTIPLIVTLIVLGFVLNFVSQALNPVVGVVNTAIGAPDQSPLVAKGIALVALLAFVFVVGAIAERHPDEPGIGSLFDSAMSRIPGVGSLYQSIDEMSDLLLDSDTESFQEVKLVEFPVEGSYTLAFLTADTPEVIERATGHDGMVSIFFPMAPNPVMGGYVLHVSKERVYDVDLTVEEGIQSIVTSGVAVGHPDEEELSDGMLERLDRTFDVERRVERWQQQVGVGEATSPPEWVERLAAGGIGIDRDDGADGENADNRTSGDSTGTDRSGRGGTGTDGSDEGEPGAERPDDGGSERSAGDESGGD
jgi:uncharacterized membrane protein